MDISRHRYFYDRIAENEMNDRNRDEIRRRMIPFPYIDSVMVRQNSDSVSGHDYMLLRKVDGYFPLIFRRSR